MTKGPSLLLFLAPSGKHFSGRRWSSGYAIKCPHLVRIWNPTTVSPPRPLTTMDSFDSINDMSAYFASGQSGVHDVSTLATGLPVEQFKVDIPPGTLCIIA